LKWAENVKNVDNVDKKTGQKTKPELAAVGGIICQKLIHRKK